jgi:hypothetical protein
MAIQFKRGTANNRTNYTPSQGELIIIDVDQTNPSIYVGDGTTAGGKLVSATSGGGGGTQNTFTTITVAGQDAIVADSATDTLSVIAGTNISITTDQSSDALTINNTSTAGTTLSGLTDVNTTGIAIGKILEYDGSNWVIGEKTGTGATTLTGLTDTPANYTSKANFFAKVNSSATGLDFVSTDTDDISEGSTNLYYTDTRADVRIGLANLSNLVDVHTTAPTDGQALVWDDANNYWEPGTISGGGSLGANSVNDSHIDWGTGANQVSTTDIPELTNLYYTDARADARISTAGSALWNTAHSWGDHSSANYLTSASLSSLTDTTIGNLSDGKVLKYISSPGAWMASTISIDELTDVDTSTTAPLNTQVLTWNGTNWVPATSTAGTTLSGLTDVNTTGIAIGKILEYSGSVWVIGEKTATGATTLIGLSDTPGTYAQQANYFAKVNSASTGLEFVSADTDDISEGSTNLYYTDARADARIGLANLSNLVDVHTTAPTDGQALVWDDANNYWEPGTISGGGTSTPGGWSGTVQFNNAGVLDGDGYFTYNNNQVFANHLTANQTITPNISTAGNMLIHTTANNAPIKLDPHGSGYVTFYGNTTRGSGGFKLIDELYTHGITIKGPPHSAVANYTLTLPDDDGGIGELLSSDGSGNLSWVAGPAGYLTDSGNWNTAYSWGNHSAAGYIWQGDFTSNGLMKRAGAFGTITYSIVADNSALWDNAYTWGDHGSAGYLTSTGVLSSHTDVHTTAPTDGQSLVWDDANSYWKPGTVSGGGSSTPGGADTEVQVNSSGVLTGFSTFIFDYLNDLVRSTKFQSTGWVKTPKLTLETYGGAPDAGWIETTANNNPITLDAHGSGKVTFKGNSTKGSGQFVLNCEANTHGITIKGPPHSAAANYTLTLPDDDGFIGELLSTDGSGNLSWVVGPAGYLTDTSDWNNAYSWGDHSAAGYITSTLTDEEVQDKVGAMLTGNTETLITATYQDNDGTIDFVVDNDLANYSNAASGFLTSETTHNDVLQDGDFQTQGIMLREGLVGSYSILPNNSIDWEAAYSWGDHSSANYLTSASLSSLTDTSIPSGIINGKFLRYLESTGWTTSTISIDDLTDVDTSTTAPLTTQVLTWDGSNWVPATSTAGTSLSGLTDVNTTGIAIGKILEYDGSNWVIGEKTATGATTLIGLSDTPANYTSKANYFAKVNSSATGLDFVSTDTDDISEGSTNLYYTNARADVRIINAGSANWNTAYGWGDHQYAGYYVLTANSINETHIDWGTGTNQVSTADIPELTNLYYTDARADARADSRILTAGSANWNTAYGWGDHGSAGYITSTLTDEEVQDKVGAMLTGNTETLITVLYQDNDGTIDFVVDNDLANYSNATSGFLTQEISHADVLQDGDFTTQGIMLRGPSSGTYSILPNASANWNTAYGWGDHSTAGYFSLTANSINETHIDWGTGTNQVSTADIPELTNLYYTDARADARIGLANLSNLVDVHTATPTDGQSLVWDDTNNYWTPSTVSGGGTSTPGGVDTHVQFNDSGQFAGDANFTYDASTYTLSTLYSESIIGVKTPNVMSSATMSIQTTANNNPITLNPHGSGKVTFEGNSTKGSGQFVLNCETNTHGITIKGPPHSAAANYTLTLPNDDGNAGDLLATDGSGNLSWDNLSYANWDTAYGWGDHSTAGYYDANTSSAFPISVLSDVVTINPTVNQILRWNGSYWINSNESTGGGGSLGANSVNDSHIDWGTGTNQVSTADIPENTNLYYTDARADARISTAGSANWNTAYGWGDHSSAGYLTSISALSINALTDVNTTGIAIGKILEYDGSNWVIGEKTGTGATTLTGLSDTPGTYAQKANFFAKVNSASTGLEFVSADTDDISEGSTNLYYTDARADARIGLANLSDLVDVNTAVPTNGQSLVWDDTNNYWTPSTVSGGGSGSSNVVDDLTPQLGGDLDVQANSIVTSTVDGNITIVPNGTGHLELGSADIVTTGQVLSGSLTIDNVTLNDNIITTDTDTLFTNGADIVTTDDSKIGMYMFKGITSSSDTSLTEIFVKGITDNRATLIDNSTKTFDIMITAKRYNTSAGNEKTGSWNFRGCIVNDGGTTSILGTIMKTVFGKTDSTYDCEVDATDVNNSLRIRVLGQTGESIKWMAVVNTIEVTV